LSRDDELLLSTLKPAGFHSAHMKAELKDLGFFSLFTAWRNSVSRHMTTVAPMWKDFRRASVSESRGILSKYNFPSGQALVLTDPVSVRALATVTQAKWDLI
ncbi:uncharacterized, partial [Tachysurus ichikawai]